MKFLGFNSVLCLSPHPDDIEFSMGGTILQCSDTVFTSVVFSTGSVYDPVSNETRWDECSKYWEGIDNIDQRFLSPLMKMYSEEEWIVLLEQKVPLKNFDAILLPPLQDTHYEHRVVHNIGMAMTRVAPASIIEYRSASAQDSWVPNTFVALFKSIVESKINRLSCFESQQKVYLQPDYMRVFHSHISSLKRGISDVEQFRIVTHYND